MKLQMFDYKQTQLEISIIKQKEVISQGSSGPNHLLRMQVLGMEVPGSNFGKLLF